MRTVLGLTLSRLLSFPLHKHARSFFATGPAPQNNSRLPFLSLLFARHLSRTYFAVGRSGCMFLASPCSRPRRAESVELGKSPTSSTSSSSKVVMRRDVHEPELAHPGEERGMSSNSTRAVTLRSAGKQVMRKLMMMMVTLFFAHGRGSFLFFFSRWALRLLVLHRIPNKHLVRYCLSGINVCAVGLSLIGLAVHLCAGATTAVQLTCTTTQNVKSTSTKIGNLRQACDEGTLLLLLSSH